MKTIYVMLSIIGWAWFLIVMAFLWVRLRRNHVQQGFEVVERNEKQS